MEILLKQTEQYRINTEQAAYEFVNDLKNNQKGFQLTKQKIDMKTKKSKGEIIDCYYLVTVEKTYNLENE